MGNNNKNKQKARLSPETKDKLKTGFGTLVSNDACIKAGREYRWFTPIILGICSVIVTLIPSFVSNMSINMGQSILGTSSVGGVENGLAAFQETLKANNASVKITDEGKLVVTDTDKEAIYNAGTTGDRYYEYKDSVTEEPILRVQFNVDNVSSDYLNNHLSKYKVTTTTTVTDSSGSTSEVVDATSTDYRVSVLVFKDTGFTMAVYNRRVPYSGSSSAFVNYSYDGIRGKSLTSLTPSATFSANPAEYLAEVKKNYQGLLTAGYESTKVSLTWRNTGILTGINAGIILLLGLVLFLITRGKRNPYRIITIWQCQKIAYWAAPAPAILSMALGFLLSNVSTMSSLTMFMFLFLYGLRIMWTSMKAFSPQSK